MPNFDHYKRPMHFNQQLFWAFNRTSRDLRDLLTSESTSHLSGMIDLVETCLFFKDEPVLNSGSLVQRQFGQF
jgi:hypothetical protein